MKSGFGKWLVCTGSPVELFFCLKCDEIVIRCVEEEKSVAKSTTVVCQI
jgi:hypothetical protein